MSYPAWTDVAWKIPLRVPPEIVQIGLGVHGGVPVEHYTMLGLWCFHLYKYDASLHVDDVEFPIHHGHAGIVPPDKPMEYRYAGRSEHLYVHFRCVQSDETVSISAMQNLGDSFGRIYEQMLEVIERNDTFTQARLWDVLWQLSQLCVPSGLAETVLHPTVRRAVNVIEGNLSEPIKVTAVAEAVGVSTSHLSRLFQQSFGETVIAHIRRRRVERALHLLTKTTLPIKAIAIMVGIPDLQHFNRTMHKSAGRSPTDARASSRGLLSTSEETRILRPKAN